jgi:hypothetical protein
MQTPLILRLFGLNDLHHHLRPQTDVNRTMSIAMKNFTVRNQMFLFLYLHKNYTLRHTSKGEALLHEDLKISNIQKEDYIYSKSGQYRASLISKIGCVSLVSYTFLPVIEF